MGQTPVIQIDIAHVFARVGGPKALLELFDAHCPGHTLNYAAVQMWKQRGRVSGQYAASLLYVLAKEKNIPLLACFYDDAGDFR